MTIPRPRLKDIAASTGLSVNTVSLALRASPRVSEPRRQQILAAAQALDYVPNAIARSLVQRATRTVGVILTDITNPILTASARHLERHLGERGYAMLLAATDNRPEKEVQALELMVSRQVDGILIYPVRHRELEAIARVRRSGRPVVLLAGRAPAGVDLVTVDNAAGAARAVERLLDAGHRRIAFLDAGRSLGNMEKAEGYAAALQSRAIEPEPALVVEPGGIGPDQGYAATAQLMALRPRPTALLASSDQLAIGALRWAADHGVRVPDALAVIGFDDITLAPFAAVPLTSVAYDALAVSEAAVRHLLSLIELEGSLPEPRAFVIEPELVVRLSCGTGRPARKEGGRDDRNAGIEPAPAPARGRRNAGGLTAGAGGRDRLVGAELGEGAGRGPREEVRGGQPG